MQQGSSTHRQGVTAAILWLAVICLYYTTAYWTPPCADDWQYYPHSWSAIIPDACQEYMSWNPRLTGTVLTRVFSYLPHGLVCTINTAGFAAYCALLVELAFPASWRQKLADWRTPLLSWLLVVAVMPKFGECFLWQCGTAFYMWGLVFGMAVLVWHRRVLQKPETAHPAALAWLIPCTFLAGAGLYNMGGILILAGAGLLVRGRIPHAGGKAAVACTMAAAIATLALVTVAPGNAERLRAIGDTGSLFSPYAGEHLMNAAIAFAPSLFSPLLQLATLVFLVRGVCKKTAGIRQELPALLAMVGGAAASAAALFISPTPAPPRAFCVTLMFVCALILYACLTEHGLFCGCFRRAAGLLLPACCLYTLYPLPMVYEQKIWWDNNAAALQPESGQEEILLDFFPGSRLRWYAAAGFRFSSNYPGDFRERGIMQTTGCKRIHESTARCAYLLSTAPGRELCAIINEKPASPYPARLEFHGSAMAGSSITIAYPLQRDWLPLAWFHQAFPPGPATAEQLRHHGCTITTLQIGADGTATLQLPDTADAFDTPHCPLLWVAASDGTFRPVSPIRAWRRESRALPADIRHLLQTANRTRED